MWTPGINKAFPDLESKELGVLITDYYYLYPVFTVKQPCIIIACFLKDTKDPTLIGGLSNKSMEL